eukprot:1424966-Rhodomonas_salina.1
MKSGYYIVKNAKTLYFIVPTIFFYQKVGMRSNPRIRIGTIRSTGFGICVGCAAVFRRFYNLIATKNNVASEPTL